MSKFKYVLLIPLVLILLYFFGPTTSFEHFDASPIISKMGLDQVETFIQKKEMENDSIKPDNEARVLWYDSIGRTENVFLYLHGFGASQYEGHPVHENLAKKYGCNLILGRFPDNGVISKHPLLHSTPKKYIEYGKEIIDMASKLGDNLYIISTSTGATVSSYLASEDDRIKGLIMLSPNFGVNKLEFDLLDGPWGKQLLYFNFKDGYREFPANNEVQKYWIHRYRVEALITLDKLVSVTMKPSVFNKIDIPYFIGHYYRDEDHKDEIISITKINTFDEATSTDPKLTRLVPFPDANTHVIACDLYNPKWMNIQIGIEKYLEEVLGWDATISKKSSSQ